MTSSCSDLPWMTDLKCAQRKCESNENDATKQLITGTYVLIGILVVRGTSPRACVVYYQSMKALNGTTVHRIGGDASARESVTKQAPLLTQYRAFVKILDVSKAVERIVATDVILSVAEQIMFRRTKVMPSYAVSLVLIWLWMSLNDLLTLHDSPLRS